MLCYGETRAQHKHYSSAPKKDQWGHSLKQDSLITEGRSLQGGLCQNNKQNILEKKTTYLPTTKKTPQKKIQASHLPPRLKQEKRYGKDFPPLKLPRELGLDKKESIYNIYKVYKEH